MLVKKIDVSLTQKGQAVDLIRVRQPGELNSDSDSGSGSDCSSSVSGDSNMSNSCIYEIDYSKCLPANLPTPPLDSSPSAVSSSNDDSSEDDLEDLTYNKERTLLVAFQDKTRVEYHYIKTLAKGSYGEVFLLSRKKTEGNDSHPKMLCLKIGLKRGDVDGDALVLKHLKGSSCQDTLVDSLVLELKFLDNSGDEQFEPVILMEHMEGNLKHFFQSYQFRNILDKYAVILFALTRITTCFFHMVNKGLYYTDVKISNCLYGKAENKFRVVLGDIGSAVAKDSQEAIATYPHMYHQKCHHFVPHIYDLIYGLLILFLEMMSVSRKDQADEMAVSRELFDNLYFREVKSLTVKERIKLLNMLFEELETLNEGYPILNQILKSIKNKTILDVKNIKETDHATQLYRLYQFFKTSYQALLKTSKIGDELGFK